jgi:hypothetical protein
MHDEVIQYCGRYLYADNPSLERALAGAKSRLSGDALGQVTFRFFVEEGTSLTVNLCVPSTHEHRLVAANLFLVLAHGASYGTFRKLEDRVRISMELLTPFRRIPTGVGITRL